MKQKRNSNFILFANFLNLIFFENIETDKNEIDIVSYSAERGKCCRFRHRRPKSGKILKINRIFGLTNFPVTEFLAHRGFDMPNFGFTEFFGPPNFRATEFSACRIFESPKFWLTEFLSYGIFGRPNFRLTEFSTLKNWVKLI